MHLADTILNFYLIKDRGNNYLTKIESFGRNLTKLSSLLMEIENNKIKISEL